MTLMKTHARCSRRCSRASRTGRRRRRYWPGNDNKYAHIPEEEIPLSECLKDTVDRCLPYWDASITPALMRGKTVLVAARGVVLVAARVD